MATPQLKRSFKTAEGRYRMAAERAHQTGATYRIQKSTKLTLAHLRGAGDLSGAYLVCNVNDNLIISDYACIDKDPLKVINFAGVQPVCHAYIPYQCADNWDLLVGLSSGEVVLMSLKQQLLDPTRKLASSLHFNREGGFNSSKCTGVLWNPLGDGTFVSLHLDGSMYLYDKAKEPSSDPAFQPVKDPRAVQISPAKSAKCCPNSRWWAGMGTINAGAFSPDGAYLALGGRDGTVRIFDFPRKELCGGCRSYYGAVLALGWSHDARYLVVGSEDDLVNIYSTEDRAVVAWCEGHSSWVSQVSFDPYWVVSPEVPSTPSTPSQPQPLTLQEGGATYRIISIGQDCQMALWEFSVDDVNLSTVAVANTSNLAAANKHAATPSTPTDNQVSPSPSSSSASSAMSAAFRKSSQSNEVVASPQAVHHLIAPSASRAGVLRIAPLLMHKIHQEPLLGLLVTQQAIVTACQGAQVKLWLRPAEFNRLMEQAGSSEEFARGFNKNADLVSTR